MAQRLKHLPAMQETWVHQEDPLEKEMATHSSILAWRTPWTEEPGVHGVAKSRTRLSNFTLQNYLTFSRNKERHGSSPEQICFF